MAAAPKGGNERRWPSTPPQTLHRAILSICIASLCVSVRAIKLFVGFGVDDHLIRELMRFIEIIYREFKKEDDVQVGGFPKSI
jgi:hypothetical protein